MEEISFCSILEVMIPAFLICTSESFTRFIMGVTAIVSSFFLVPQEARIAIGKMNRSIFFILYIE
jgi:hypothetical protein